MLNLMGWASHLLAFVSLAQVRMNFTLPHTLFGGSSGMRCRNMIACIVLPRVNKLPRRLDGAFKPTISFGGLAIRVLACSSLANWVGTHQRRSDDRHICRGDTCLPILFAPEPPGS